MPRMTMLRFLMDLAGIISIIGVLMAFLKLPAPPMPVERNTGALYEEGIVDVV
jgi:hypothetical protein